MALQEVFPKCQVEDEYNPKVDGAFEVKFIGPDGKEILLHSKTRGDGSLSGDKFEKMKAIISSLLG